MKYLIAALTGAIPAAVIAYTVGIAATRPERTAADARMAARTDSLTTACIYTARAGASAAMGLVSVLEGLGAEDLPLWAAED